MGFIKKSSIFLLILFVFLTLKNQALADTLFLDTFNGSGDLSQYNNSYVLLPGFTPATVVTDHVVAGQVSNSYYIYTGVNPENSCASIDFLAPFATIFLRMTPDVSQFDQIQAYFGSSWYYYHKSNGVYYNNSGPLSFDTNVTHNLKACINGTTFTAYLDGQLFTTQEDVDNHGGYPGFGLFSPSTTGDNFLIESINNPTLNSLSPVNLWVGLKNSDDIGVKFDLKAEVYAGSALVSSGESDSVVAGSSGFRNGKLDTINFNSFIPVDFPPGTQLSLKLYVRNACSGSGHNSGVARLWYNDSQANSAFDATIDSADSNYYLASSAVLSTSVGSGPKQTVDVQSGAKCSAFKSFGTWAVTP